MKDASRVVVTVEDGVLTAALNRPEKRNAIDTPMIEELLAMLERAELDGTVRVVALRGVGDDFCAGMDLQELLVSAEASTEANRLSALRFAEIFVRMRKLSKPVVAVVKGHALAGGCGLSTACDIVLAAESARFGFPEVHRGFVPALVLTLLRRSVGEKVAFDLASTGRILTADEAMAAGLVSRVYEDSDLEEQVGEVLRGLAGSSVTALAFTKRQFYDLEGVPFTDSLRMGADVSALARATPDFRAGLKAFFNK